MLFAFFDSAKGDPSSYSGYIKTRTFATCQVSVSKCAFQFGKSNLCDELPAFFRFTAGNGLISICVQIQLTLSFLAAQYRSLPV